MFKLKVIILAGGFGTRISEESHLKPKPMIEIGNMPIMWHIMKHYLHYGYNEFIICCGYKQHVIKEFFADYYLYGSDVTFDFSKGGEMTVHNNFSEPWKITLVDTGLGTMTGGRVKRVQPYVGNERFMLTYGDGVCNVDIDRLLETHISSGMKATITAVQPGGKFGALDIKGDNSIHSFTEKKKEDGGWINGGFMVLEPDIFDLIEGDNTTLEREPLETLANNHQMGAFLHDGFWQCMDTMRDKEMLEKLWNMGNAPWKTWT